MSHSRMVCDKLRYLVRIILVVPTYSLEGKLRIAYKNTSSYNN